MRTLLSLLFVLVALPARAEDTQFHRYLAGVVIASAADNLTTQLALTPFTDAQGHSVHRTETNPLLSSNRGANAIAQGIATVALVVALHKIEPSHPRLARSFAWGLITLGARDTLLNIRR